MPTSRPRPALLPVLATLAAGLATGPFSVAAPNVTVWDTQSRLPTAPEQLDRGGWKAVPTDLLALEKDPAKASSDPGYYGREYTFRGDAVIENHHLLAVFSAASGRVAIFTRPAAAGGEPARFLDCTPLLTGSGPAAISGIELLRNAADEAAVSVTFGEPTAAKPAASATFVFGKSEIVEVRSGDGVRGFRFDGALDYGIVPGFLADDLVFNPREITEPATLSIPAENMLVGLAGGGEREAVFTWPKAGQPTRLHLGADASGRRRIDAVEFENPGTSVFLGVLAAPGLWYRQELKPTDLETDVALNWKPPFPARWKTQLREGDVKTTFHFHSGRGEIWRGVPGSYKYPVWFEGGAAFLRPSKKVPPKGECLVYFLEGQETPADVLTPIDVLKSTLGRTAADERIDLAGRKLRTHHRRGGDGVRRACTCGCTEAIQAVFEAGEEVERRNDIRGAVDDMIYFVARHVERIGEYRHFADDLIRFLEQSGKTSPELAAFAEQLAEIARLIPQECTLQAENMKSPQHAEELAKKTLALTAGKDTGNLKAYMELLKAWRDMGGSQDYVVAQCHAVTRKLAQEAGYGGVASPAATRLAEAVRQRCRGVLRNPDGYEIWAEY